MTDGPRCYKCSQPIRLSKGARFKGWQKLNPNGTRHTCQDIRTPIYRRDYAKLRKEANDD